MANEARNASLRPASKWTKAITLFNAIDTASTSSAIGLGGPYQTFGVMAYRATTGTSGGSTKVSYRLQGNIDNSTSQWVTIGAATRAITAKSSQATILTSITSTQGPITSIRARINLFTTSAGANPDKVKFTLKVIPYT